MPEQVESRPITNLGGGQTQYNSPMPGVLGDPVVSQAYGGPSGGEEAMRAQVAQAQHAAQSEIQGIQLEFQRRVEGETKATEELRNQRTRELLDLQIRLEQDAASRSAGLTNAQTYAQAPWTRPDAATLAPPPPPVYRGQGG